MYGSVVNRLMERSRQPEPQVGMGATVCYYSDRSPVTIVAVRKNKAGEVTEIETRSDHVGPNKLAWPAQDYDITPATSLEDDPETPTVTWRVDNKGRYRSTYVENGRRKMSPPKGGPGLSIGHRDYYTDPHF